MFHRLWIGCEKRTWQPFLLFKGRGAAAAVQKVPFRITTSQDVIEEDLYFYMIMNSAGTGGFTNLSPEASITDGKFEFIAIKGKPLIEMTPVLMKCDTGNIFMIRMCCISEIIILRLSA